MAKTDPKPKAKTASKTKAASKAASKTKAGAKTRPEKATVKAARSGPAVLDVPAALARNQAALGLGPLAHDHGHGLTPLAPGLCADLRRSIVALRLRIRKKHQLIGRIHRTIDELHAEPTTDPATIAALELQVSRLEEEIAQDLVDLDSLQIDYTFAGCGSQDG